MKPLLLALLVGCGETSTEVPPSPASPAGAPSTPVVAPTPAAAPATAAPATTPATASSRDMADVAFNMAMQAYETGSPDAQAYIPQAIAAYESAGPLDADGLFHLGVLQQAAGDNGPALFTAEQILAVRPTHLLALGIAGRAAAASGDVAAARGYRQRLLDAFDAEQGAVAEYGHHGALMPIYKEEAVKFLAQ